MPKNQCARRQYNRDCLLWFDELIYIREQTEGKQDNYIWMAASKSSMNISSNHKTRAKC